MDTISDDVLDQLENAANTPAISHVSWLSVDQARSHLGHYSDAAFVALASPKTISDLIHRLRIAEDKLRVFEDLPPPALISYWRHGNGVLCAGSLRIASEDFDTNPTKEFRKEFWDWSCGAMNAMIQFKIDQEKEQ